MNINRMWVIFLFVWVGFSPPLYPFSDDSLEVEDVSSSVQSQRVGKVKTTPESVELQRAQLSMAREVLNAISYMLKRGEPLPPETLALTHKILIQIAEMVARITGAGVGLPPGGFPNPKLPPQNSGPPNNSGKETAPSLTKGPSGNPPKETNKPTLPNPSGSKESKDFPPVSFSKGISIQDGVRMYLPDELLNSSGDVDIIIQFRGDVPQRFSQGGTRAIVIACDTSGLSSAMMAKFGDKNFVLRMVQEALKQASKKQGRPVKMGKLALGSFSAGYAPLGVALSNPEVRKMTDAVMVIDGIHYGGAGKPNPTSHQPFLDFAREAASGNKLMVVSHSSIKPTYSSSTDAANYLAQKVGAQRIIATASSNRYKNRYGATTDPSTRADQGGFHVEGYSGGAARNHVEQIDNLGNLWRDYLAPRWK